MQKYAAIDNDFLNHMVSFENHSGIDVYDFILRFFKEMGFKAVMHPLVRECEKNPAANPIEEKLFSSGIISVPELTDIWREKPGGKSFYEIMVRQIYHAFTYQEYPCGDVCGKWEKQRSLGEVHTAAMCVFMGCDYFLSDDNGVARFMEGIVKNRTQHRIEVINRRRCYELIRGSGAFSREELLVLKHKRTN